MVTRMERRPRFLAFPLAILLGLLVSCDQELSSKPRDSGTRLAMRLQWAQPIDSALFASTRTVSIVLSSGSDTLYRQDVDFGLGHLDIPTAVPSGGMYALSVVGTGSTGRAIWSGGMVFTAQGEEMTVDIPSQMGLSPVAVASFSPFANWRMQDTIPVDGTWRYLESDRLNLASDSSYTSFTWGIYAAGSSRDTVFYATEEGTYSIRLSASSSAVDSGRIVFQVGRSTTCSDSTLKNLCGNATYASRMKTKIDTTVVRSYRLEADTLVIVADGAKFRYRR